MITIRKNDERGHANHGWLDTNYSFSFADYHDPQFMGFRALRVINEDTVTAGTGFPLHGHKDMEIISYVVKGAMQHTDSMGNGSTIWAGDVQHMSAGTGIRHSEFNHSKTEDLHFLQIWLHPHTQGLKPSYTQKSFTNESAEQALTLVASPQGEDNSVHIQQDVRLYIGKLGNQQQFSQTIAPGRHVWIQMIDGSLKMNDQLLLNVGDGAAISDETALKLSAQNNTHFLLFDLA